MSSLVEQLKTRLTIVDVVSSYLKLEKQGSTLRARCPFHHEKTPSFFVSPVRNSFYCFGCNKGGDIFTFVEEIEGVDFKGALETLAARAGLEVTDYRTSRGEIDAKAKLKELMLAATQFFEDQLRQSSLALKYLTERGVSAESRKLFRIGYAPESWRNLYDHLLVRGYSAEEQHRAGMVIQSEKGYYDRFRNRIMFPICDAGGAVVGFSGRILPGAMQSKETAKYINSPETPLYSKSNILYGYDKAKLAIRKCDCTVLVEGQMDLVMSHQAGVSHAVAVSGTALTPNHLQMLTRLSNNIVMAFDQDVAGFNAARRGIEMALTLGMDVRIALVPHAKDPADLVRENPALWRETVTAASPVIDALLETVIARGLIERDRRHTVETEVLPYVARLQSKLDQAHYVRKVSEFLNIREDAVWESVRAFTRSVPSDQGKAHLKTPDSTPQEAKSSRVGKRILMLLLWQETLQKPAIIPGPIRAAIGRLLKTEEIKRLEEEIGKSEKFLYEVERWYQGHTDLDNECRQLLYLLEEELLKERLEAGMKHLRDAERRKDQAAIEAAIQTCHLLSQELQTLKNSKTI